MSLYSALSDLDYLNEADPRESCADCGTDIEPGFVRCIDCQARLELEQETANDDPRRI
jgi:hypothetical protein